MRLDAMADLNLDDEVGSTLTPSVRGSSLYVRI